MIEGGLEVKLPTIWRDEAAEVGRVREERRRRKKLRDKRTRQKEKSRNTIFVHCLVGPEGRKVAPSKLRVWSHRGSCEIKNCSPPWCEEHVEAKTLKTQQIRPISGSREVEKVQALVARSTF